MSSFQSRAVARRQLLLAQYAEANRHHCSWSEQILWEVIRGGVLGVTFRRQVPVGRQFIADFYAAEVRLIVEVDGLIHGLKAAADRRRDAKLMRLGFTVVRVPAELVVHHLAEAVERIRSGLSAAVHR